MTWREKPVRERISQALVAASMRFIVDDHRGGARPIQRGPPT